MVEVKRRFIMKKRQVGKIGDFEVLERSDMEVKRLVFLVYVSKF